MHYTYVLETTTDPRRRYIGITSDLRARLEAHNAGSCTHTKKYRPWKVSVYVAFNERSLAARFEQYLKSGAGAAWAKRHFPGR